MRVVEVSRHSFLADGLSTDAVVIDLGMNRGDFTQVVSRRFGCRIIGVEPVPELWKALPQIPRVTAEQRAVTAEGGAVMMHLNPDTCATIDPRLAQPDAATLEVPATTLGALLERHGVDRVALVKLDVEGAELEVLRTVESSVLHRIDQITVEFHDFIDPSQGVAVAAVIRRLEREGFACFRFSLDNTDVLFINQARIPFGLRERLAMAARYKYPRGIARRARRLLLGGR